MPLCIQLGHDAIKLKIDKNQIPSKYTNSRRLNNSLPSDGWLREEIKKEIKNFLELNENENATKENFWDILKAVRWGKFIVLSAYIKKSEGTQINNFMI